MTAVEITAFPNARMTVADFERERVRLQGLYGGSRKEAGARYEQALATLFYKSGWTQDELAKKEGKGKPFISRVLTFGRFLGFLEELPAGNNSEKPPLGLTEFRFRGFWERTDSSETNHRIRYMAVLGLMQEEALAPRTNRSKDFGKQIVAAYADGKWRDIAVIAKKTGAALEDVRAVLENILAHKTFRCTDAARG